MEYTKPIELIKNEINKARIIITWRDKTYTMYSLERAIQLINQFKLEQTLNN